VHFASAGAYFDIILDDKGKLYRVQVKGSMKPRQPPNSYSFKVLKDKTHANFDLIAYVALDRKLVAYELVPKVKERYVSIRKFEFMTIGLAIADFNAK
jgi:hypothetical protein